MQDTDDMIEQMKGSSEMTCLRVSDLRYNFVREVPDEVDKLLHLRLLDLSNQAIEELPETVCNLFNLQTLKLNGCDSLWKLPEGIGKLHNLRHLELKRTDRLSYFPWGLERLRCLPTLSKVILDYDGGKGCQIGELNFLDHIQGEVRIQGLERVASSKHVKLKEKEKLRSLALSFSAEERQGEEESVLDGLQPHTNLAELEIQGYQGNKFPSWMMSTNTALPNLVTLSLVDCNQCSELPALGRLQYLETLYLSGLDSVKRIGCEFYGLGSTDSVVVFPKLHTFTIRSMKECEEWHLPFPRDVEIFPKLRKLTVAKFMSLQMLPPGLGKLKSLEQVSLYGVKFQGPELFRIITRNSDDGNVTLSAHESVFPVLKKLELFDMPDWVEQECEIRRDEEVEGFIMPGLCKLEISHCLMLKVVPHYLFSPALSSLKIWDCPQLTGRQPCLPPLLENLEFKNDTGIFSKSIISGIGTPDHNENDHPNLHSFSISDSRQSSLPQGFNQLTAIQTLVFRDCEFLDFTPEDLKHLPMLQLLEILRCPILEERCRKRESWTTNSHIPKIELNQEDDFIPE